VNPSVEFSRVSPRVSVWSRYDSSVKAELFATAIESAPRVLLIDPIAPLPEELSGGSPQAVILTNGNHARAAMLFGAPIYANRGAHSELALPNLREVSTAEGLSDELSVIPIAGAAAGEIALYSQADGGTLVIGDALINMGSYGFTFLPAKYCENHKLMRRSLRVLLDLEFERILFAHGLPIVTNARQRLATLLMGEA
jgi:glyoxylase-like metal-dependent hydrolase (beta-lactamase superfamily II)